ncbi:DUF29 domain-containing protein (plasmid) [Rhodovastum atsumiense]|uniref:DUF29 domain-containing protein n=1 Tax=Rhodovastum atsumiense TaxID=504468 RepID=A0A5M6IM27_9PROT|nr:DUF29 domain-containing protein [Rhodovastum atsumiense]KAA5608618.1 DUF29 domain-containing protein [Rhodovastum atsumiense]CAH2605902.1 DUF29 domain-containing protein [Rhodovastum atsumiense]
MSDYDTDILAWSEQQSALLKRLAVGELVNHTVLDWANIADEIEDVGRNELHAVGSLLVQLMAHRLKLQAWPGSQAVRGWRKKVLIFQKQLRRRFAASMRQRLVLADLYAEALLHLPDEVDGQPAPTLPDACPWTLDDLLQQPG